MNASPISYKRHHFPPQIIARAVWLYFRFPLSLRLVEEMLLERGIVVSYETIRRWARKFGPDHARRLRRKKPSRNDVWHLDEVQTLRIPNSPASDNFRLGTDQDGLRIGSDGPGADDRAGAGIRQPL